VRAPSSERPVPLKLPREREQQHRSKAYSQRSRGGERHTRQGDQRCARRAASGLCRSSFRESESSSIDRKRIANAAAAASVTPDRAISDARAEQRAACAAQASERARAAARSSFRESESCSLDQENSRRSRDERHTRQGDQWCARRAASGLCCSSFRESESSITLKLPREREQQHRSKA
jgi:hypothetical protein